ncbi:MAG: hypothetical protein IJ038_04020 [Clostridia bacterium]|nr:hypothetical protein [Clostridia bacterium]
MDTTVKENKKTPRAERHPVREATLFLVGGLGYYGMEVIFRGYSHWSMALCGGICLCSIFHVNKRMKNKNIGIRALAGAGIITTVELICGCIVNLMLGWRVWDYSHLPMNILGQICLPFTLLWFGLCFPVCAVCSRFCGKSGKRQNSR